MITILGSTTGGWGGGSHDHLLNMRVSALIIDEMFIYESQKYEERGYGLELANHLVLIACSISLERVGYSLTSLVKHSFI